MRCARASAPSRTRFPHVLGKVRPPHWTSSASDAVCPRVCRAPPENRTAWLPARQGAARACARCVCARRQRRAGADCLQYESVLGGRPVIDDYRARLCCGERRLYHAGRRALGDDQPTAPNAPPPPPWRGFRLHHQAAVLTHAAAGGGVSCVPARLRRGGDAHVAQIGRENRPAAARRVGPGSRRRGRRKRRRCGAEAARARALLAHLISGWRLAHAARLQL